MKTKPRLRQSIVANALTRQQCALCDALLDGCSNEAIAKRLGVAQCTVKRKLSKLCLAFNARNRISLVLALIRLGYRVE